MEYTGKTFFKASVKDKTQDDGDQTVDTEGSLYPGIAAKRNWQAQVEVSETPDAGTLSIKARLPGASEYLEEKEVDLTAGNQRVSFEGVFTDIKVSPDNFDSDKSYSVYFCAA
ncbi:MAG: hypothetical protein ACOCR8_04245 [Desulfosalsimonas sp.]